MWETHAQSWELRTWLLRCSECHGPGVPDSPLVFDLFLTTSYPSLTPPPLVFQNQLSGNLLRKFKNSNGWQKLWVVFTNFCLFFYKSHQVRAPHGQLALT